MHPRDKPTDLPYTPAMIFSYLQHILPQHLLTAFAGKLAEAKTPWLKNWLIQDFMRRYQVDLSEAAIPHPEAFASFNDFFIRQLKPSARPVTTADHAICSPADGTISEIGRIKEKQLLQAKNFYFDLDHLLGQDATMSKSFVDGHFATIYLAPRDYHRVHLPLGGDLIKTVYIPGKLFSVNRMSSQCIPQLFARNERVIAYFETIAGPMAIILVGALIVGSIKMAWMDEPIRASEIIVDKTCRGAYKQNDEIGYFKAGSTVIVLFGKDQITWSKDYAADSPIKVGQLLGSWN